MSFHWNRRLLLAACFVFAALVAACGETPHEESEANVQPVTLSREIPNSDAARGRELAEEYGCGACHKIPGIPKADGNVGPPLNDWVDRQYIAGNLPNTPENLIYWIKNPQAVEPGTVMPNLDAGDEDARDIAAFLYTLQDAGVFSDLFAAPRAWFAEVFAPEDERVPVTGEQGGSGQFAAGRRIYDNTCTFCHQAGGQGLEGSFPPLAGSGLVTHEDPTGAIRTVLFGRGQMPSFADRYTDEEIAAVVTYIRNAWDNQASAVTPEQVGQQRQEQE